MKRKGLYIVLGFLIVAAVGGVIFWQTRPVSQAQEVYRAAQVERGSMVVSVSVSGRIKPEKRVGLAFERPGRVEEVLVEVGERVVAGDALVRLEADQLALQVEQSKAALAAAEAQLAQLQAGPSEADVERAEANVRAAEAQLSAAAAQRDQVASGPSAAQIAAAEAKLEQARTQKEIAQDTYDLTDKENKDKKEQANYDLYVAKEELRAAQAELDELLAGADADELRKAQANVAAAAAQRDAAQAQLDLLKAGTTEEDIDDAQAQVAQAQAALELAELSLDQTVLRAPFDGVLSEINVTPGELPPTMEPPVVLLDDSAFQIAVNVDEMDVSQLAQGQKAQVTVEALPDVELTGVIASIAPVASIEGGVISYDVVIELADTDASIRADMTANATIKVKELTDVLKIPTWVVRVDRDTGQMYVHRRVGGTFERVDISLGVREGGFVQVMDGLSEGDEVVRLEDDAASGFPRQ